MHSNPATVEWILVAHAAATLFMTGLIWFVQVVHYPLFAHVDREAFVHYQREHVRRTAWVVSAPMLLEMMLAVVLAFTAREPLVYTGLVLLILVWASTWVLQVPAHQHLGAGFDAAAHRRLVLSNWIRTAAWTARAVIALLLVLQG